MGLQPWLAGLSWAGDLGNSMVSRVPATLATCPCHSPETPTGPCSPVSVPAQAPPPWEDWLHACNPSGSEDPYWDASGLLGPWDALKDYASASDTTSLFTSNPFFPAWKLLTSLPGQENPHR